MKIVADPNIPALEEHFGDLGELALVEGRQIQRATLEEADVLLVRSVTRVDAALVEGSAVRFVGSATSGFDHVDRPALQRAGIAFAHAPGSNAQSVVEYVLAAICHHPAALRTVLGGDPVGIVGYGHVGRRLAAVLNAMGIASLVSDPWLEERETGLVSLTEVLDCPVISLHCELTTAAPWPSNHLLDQARLDSLRPGTLLVNASRGPVIDNFALRRRLTRANDILVVLDVWEQEPAIDRALMALCSLATPHIAGYSLDAKLSATAQLANALRRQLGGVEPASFSAATTQAEPLSLDDSADVAQALCRLIGQRYAIAADDKRLRDLLRDASPESAAAAFDRLRRDYPERRELARSTVRYKGSDPGVMRLLDHLECATG